MKKLFILLSVLIMLIASASGALAGTEPLSGEDNSGQEASQENQSGENDGYEDLKFEYYKGEVLQVQTITSEQNSELSENEIQQKSLIKISKGKFAGRVYAFENTFLKTDPKQIVLKKGTLVMLSATLDAGETDIKSIDIYDYYRTTQLVWTALIAVILIAAVCLFKGLKSLISLLVIILGLYFYFIPLMIKGISPIILMIPLCSIVAVISITLDIGFTFRSFSAGAGVIIAMLIAGLCGQIMEKASNLVGLGETELQMLLFVPSHTPISYTGLMFATSMLASLGAIVDVCVGVTEEMNIVKSNNPYITKMSLINYGLVQGRFNMSRNINTVFYVALANIMPIWIIYSVYNTSFVELMNMDVISTCLFRTFAAIMGIVISMPITALIFAQQIKKGSMYS